MSNEWKKKESRQFAPAFIFKDAGDAVEGQLVQITEGETSLGTATFALFDDGKEQHSIIITSALSYLVTPEDIGKEMRIVFTGEVKNPKSGRYYKAFDVFTK